jgi:hypothetical protein
LVAVGICLLWRGFRSWRKPYVLLTGDLMVVFDSGRPKHYVPFNAIAAVERGFNRTRLLMRDGLKLHVSHLGFANGAEVERFRAELLKRINGGVG